MYTLGIDLGTTYTAAATWRDDHAEIASLGSRAASIPSVVLLRQDETFLAGESASRRGQTEPQRVAREFKRRLGDTTPIILGGVPYSAEALMAKLLSYVVSEVSTREGGAPAAVCVCHPANWGPYKLDLLRQAHRMAGLEQPVMLVTEPEAAAACYAHQQRIPTGAMVAVYDLGGGTFDATVLRRVDNGFEILGQPEGIERLGGVDFDAAVFDHVSRALGGLSDLDEDDPAVISAVARLRDECTQAKEALSTDTDVSIPVLLPNLVTEVRLTRAELEAMVRPALYGSIEALNRALRSAGVSASHLHSVLLVGGSSRMPIVAQLVGAELGRPVSVDAHPKHVVPLGAARLASGLVAGPGTTPTAVPVPAATTSAATAAFAVAATPPAAEPATLVDHGQVAPATLANPVTPAEPAGPGPAIGQAAPAAALTASPPARGARRSTRVLVAVGVVLIALLAAGGVALALKDGDSNGAAQGVGIGAASQTPDAQQSGSADASPSPSATAEPLPADEECTDEIKANTRWVCLTSAVFDGKELVIEYQADFAGSTPNVGGGYHLHIYGGDGTKPADDTMGLQSSTPGSWIVEDQNPSVINLATYQAKFADWPKVCARIANSKHRLVPDANDTYVTGNCVPVQRG